MFSTQTKIFRHNGVRKKEGGMARLGEWKKKDCMIASLRIKLRLVRHDCTINYYIR